MRKILIVIALILCGCNYNRFEQTPQTDDTPMEPNCSINQLTLGQVRSSRIVRGVVVTSDSTGNFYKEFLITDPEQHSTLALRAGVYEIYTMFPRSAVVCVELQGAEITSVQGLLTASLPSNLALVWSKVRREPLDYVLNPITTTIGDLGKLAAGSLVELQGVFFKDAGFRSFSGEAQLLETQGDSSVVVYTSPYASFAQDALPTGSLTVRGILLFVDGKSRLKLDQAPIH